MSNYIDLHNHSTFSCAMTAGDAYGGVEAIVDRAVELGWSAVSLTDHGWIGGAPSLYKAAKKAGIKPVIGCELYVTPDFAHGVRGKEVDGLTFHLTVIALNREGYQNLVAWTTEAMQRENYHRKPRISIFRMLEIAPWPMHHNVVFSGCLASELNRTLAESNGAGMALGAEYIRQMKSVFPNFYIELFDHTVPKFVDDSYPAYMELLAKEERARGQLIDLAKITNTPLILCNDSHMQRASDRRAHIAMKSISRDEEQKAGKASSNIAKYLADYGYYGNYMRDMEKVASYNGIPREAIENIGEIVEEVNIVLDPLDNFTYSIPFSGYSDPVAKIRRRAEARLAKLERKHGRVARERFEMELGAMGDFAHYLLLISDFIIAARKQGILTWTRGSAANSLLCYTLKVHEIDSIEYGLTFSRFFNPARKKLPDVDIDIQPGRYEDFMQIVQEKMEPLVGKGQVEQISNYGTAANRSAFRQAATALGLPKEQQDELAKLLPQMIDSDMMDENADVFMALREDYPELYDIAGKIFDQVKNVSQHACAWAFGTPERPLKEWVPMYLIASSGKLVTQFDFKSFEDFGLVKGDFLRLKTLDVAANVMRMIGKSPMDFHKIPLDDETTFEMIREGKVDGVHTIQGKEVRKGCIEIGVENVHDVILAAALYRPANTREEKDKLYVERRRGLEHVEYSHEIAERILGPTLGVPVFQEQAMDICYAVGMDDAGVDDVYQAIKKAKGAGRGAKELFEKVKPLFKAPAKKAAGGAWEALWEDVKAFQGYGFNKGHASSYGVLAVRMAYLKRHYSAEYFAALLDVFPERANYIAAARGEGYTFLPPDVNHSGSGFGIDRYVQNGLRVGVGKVKGLGPVAVKQIIEGQPFSDFDDFKKRTDRRSINATSLENLATLGALESLGVKGIPSDLMQFKLLGFTLEKPRAFKGIKPKHISERKSDSGWKHLGREKGVQPTSGRASVSKLFWIPEYSEIEEKRVTYFELKTSPWAQVKTFLLNVLDENGIKFHLMVNEDKEQDARLLDFFYRKCQGAVVCLDGSIRMPFVQNGPPGFRMYGVTGTYENDPQIWGVSDKKKSAILALNELKRRARRG